MCLGVFQNADIHMSNLCLSRRYGIPIQTIQNTLIDSSTSSARSACTLHNEDSFFSQFLLLLLCDWTEHIQHITIPVCVYVRVCIMKPIEKALSYKIIIIVKRTAAPFGVALWSMFTCIFLFLMYVCAWVWKCWYIMDSKDRF